mgnify:CR=1 FL=1
MLTAPEVAELEKYLAAKKRDGTPLATPEERAKVEELLGRQAEYVAERPWAKYFNDPLGYFYNVLKVKLLSKDRVSAESGHSVGKSFCMAGLINWHFDTYDKSWTIITGPKAQSLDQTIWTTVRGQRNRIKQEFPNYPLCLMPKASQLWDNEEHWAMCQTADQGASFQGRHLERMMFIFEESEGLVLEYFTATNSMFQPSGKHLWLSGLNPVTLTSPVFQETRKTDIDGRPNWKVFSISALDHPNIAAEARGEEPPVPAAVTTSQIRIWLKEYGCERIDVSEKDIGDFEFPPNSGQWWRPGPEAEARILGRRPRRGADSVWNEALWQYCESLYADLATLPQEESMLLLPFPLDEFPQVGCDVARVLGGDDCDIHWHWGGISLGHDTANGRPIPDTAARLKEVCDEVCEFANAVRRIKLGDRFVEWYGYEIPAKVDDDNCGAGVTDLRGEYNFVPVHSGWTANNELKYPNVRSELWFTSKERAEEGGVCLAFLDEETRDRLKIQATSPMWGNDGRKRRVVEEKKETKKRLGRSPDAIDAMNLSHWNPGRGVATMIGPSVNDRESMAQKLGLFGRVPKKKDQEPEDDQPLQPQQEARPALLRSGKARPFLFSRRH